METHAQIVFNPGRSRSRLLGRSHAPGAGQDGVRRCHRNAPLVVLELFQSQGCSSCPPANANVNALTGRSGVLALSFAVTYWD